MRRILGVVGLVVLLACASDDGSSGSGTSGGASSSGAAAGSSSGGSKGPVSGSANGYQYAFAPTSVGLDCNDTAAAALARGAPKVTVGTSTIVVGYQQVSGNDQDPIVARCDGDQKVFCEHSKKGGGIDGRAYGVTWDGAD
ncbi:MAG: hypothetical protein HOO96_27375, partial [Polyangiaceae bacterium]|nr:hypothetical protein [Polyangiaceae bacterium]